MATPADDARMKLMAPDPSSGLVYLFRNETLAFGVHMEVFLDGAQWGSTVAKSYMVWRLPPGRHHLRSHAENDFNLDIDVYPGERLYIWQEVKMGVLFARSALHFVSPEYGATGVGECKLIQMPLPPPTQPAPRRSPPPAAQAQPAPVTPSS